LKELAPRDIVARAIVSEIKRRDVPCVFLDVTHLDPDMLRSHFPTVYEKCLSVGIDITREPIPIVPAQHYQCGGVVTDLDGRTNIERLYAAGEVACTGVHGANRLASNSLLEAMVFGFRAACHTLDSVNLLLPGNSPLPQNQVSPDVEAAPSEADVTRMREEIQHTMQRYAGIVRTTSELQYCRQEIAKSLSVLNRWAELNPQTLVTFWETRNMAQVGWLIVESALHRKESRGLHYILDYPEPVETENHDTVLKS
jgi:L-aspartate oxidase